MKRKRERPNRWHRDLAEAIYRLRPGKYDVLVEQLGEAPAFSNLAVIKREGSTVIELPNLHRMYIFPRQ